MSRRTITIALIAFSGFILSCTHNADVETSEEQVRKEEQPGEVVISPDSVLVSLSSNLEFLEEPLTRATSDNDLFAVKVYYYFDNDKDVKSECAAYGTFDDLSKVIIKMSKKRLYGIDVAYIPNAKNLVYQYADGSYGLPFNPMWSESGALNQLVYRDPIGGDPVFGMSQGVTQDKDVKEGNVQHNMWSSVTRYQGYTVIDPAIDTVAKVDLYYQMIGFRIKITEFTTGSVSIQSIFPHTYTASPSADNTGLIDIVVNAEYMPTCAISYGLSSEEGNSYTVDDIKKHIEEYYESMLKWGTVQINYKGNNGETISLYTRSSSFKFRPNTRYILEFSLSDAIKNGGLDVNIVDNGTMEDVSFPL